MALVLKFGTAPTATCKAFYLFDATGVYSSSSTGSWGTPNPDTSSIANATFQMQGLVSGIDKTITVYPTLPFAEPDIEKPTTLFPIVNLDLGLSSTDNIPSDVYLGTYTCYNNSRPVVPYVATGYFYNDCSHLCCLDELQAKKSACGCGDESDLGQKINEVAAMIRSIHTAIGSECNEVEKAKDMVKKINSLCSSEGCSC